MGVTHDRSAALDRAFEFTEATQELVVELALLKQCLRLTRERALGTGEFCGESGDDGLWRADGLRLQLFDVVGETMDKADNCLNALRVNPADVSLAE
jgi:hypothetical protein